MARLQLEHLVKQYGKADEPAVHDLSLDVEDGEFVCLLGPSGCGKTTTLRMIGGFLKPDAGDVRIDGVSIVREPPERRPTAMVFQRYALWPHMTVWDNIAFGLQVRRRPRDETLSNLDAQLRIYMRTELTAIQRRVGITTVFVTHDQEEAMSIADRIAVMNAGVIEQVDTPQELYANPATLFVA